MGNFRTSTRTRVMGSFPEGRANEETTMRSKNPPRNAVSSFRNFERKEQAIYALPEPRGHVHRAANPGRSGTLPAGEHETAIYGDRRHQVKGHGEKFSRRMEAAVIALLEQPTIPEAARAAGISSPSPWHQNGRFETIDG